jgi:hypothetical protein
MVAQECPRLDEPEAGAPASLPVPIFLLVEARQFAARIPRHVLDPVLSLGQNSRSSMSSLPPLQRD